MSPCTELEMHLNPPSTRGGIYASCLKRIFDILCSILGLIVLSPFLLIISIVLFISHRGTPFFIQERVGRNLKPFKIIKFKTMNDKKDADGKHLPDEERTDPLGHLLRATSIDELPELINVIKGDMSLVGPRPWISSQMDSFPLKTRANRMTLRPGISGWAQILGRNNLTFRQRVCLDLQYKRNLTLYLDLKIILYTFYKVIKREGILQHPRAFTKTPCPKPPKDSETRGLKGNAQYHLDQ